MDDCDELVYDRHRQMSDQIHLAILARGVPIAATHMDLVVFSGKRARFAILLSIGLGLAGLLLFLQVERPLPRAAS